MIHDSAQQAASYDFLLVFANRQLQLSDAAHRDRLAAADQQLRQL